MDWVSIKDGLPAEGERTRCKVELWRHGALHHKEEIEAEYTGVVEAIGRPMWDIETYDHAFAVVTHWKPLTERKR